MILVGIIHPIGHVSDTACRVPADAAHLQLHLYLRRAGRSGHERALHRGFSGTPDAVAPQDAACQCGYGLDPPVCSLRCRRVSVPSAMAGACGRLKGILWMLRPIPGCP